MTEASHPDMALQPTLQAVPEATIKVVPNSSTDPETGLFFFLVEFEGEPEFDRFEAAVDADGTVADWTVVSSTPETGIYRMAHSERAKLLSPKIIEVGGLMLEAETCRTGWRMRLQVPDRPALASVWEFCETEGISFDLVRLYRQDEWAAETPVGLTDAQRDAILTAYRNGYFEEPRETSLEELADELGISPTAVGGRIRRGTAELVRRTLAEE